MYVAIIKRVYMKIDQNYNLIKMFKHICDVLYVEIIGSKLLAGKISSCIHSNFHS